MQALPHDLKPGDWVTFVEGVMKVTRWRDRYAVVWNKGDYDEHYPPGPNDIDEAFLDTLPEAQRERKMLAKESGLPLNHYMILRQHVTDWEVVDVPD